MPLPARSGQNRRRVDKVFVQPRLFFFVPECQCHQLREVENRHLEIEADLALPCVQVDVTQGTSRHDDVGSKILRNARDCG